MNDVRILVVFLAVLCGSPNLVLAQAHRGRTGGARVDIHLDLGWYQSFGAGFRVDIPVADDGLIDGVNDELSISPGAELFFWDYSETFWGIWPLVAVQWNFYLGRDWSIFPELGLTLFYGEVHHEVWFNQHHVHDGNHVHLWPFFGFGARYHFNASNALLLRVNWPAGFQVGITF